MKAIASLVFLFACIATNVVASEENANAKLIRGSYEASIESQRTRSLKAKKKAMKKTMKMGGIGGRGMRGGMRGGGMRGTGMRGVQMMSITCPGSILDGVQALPQLSTLRDHVVTAGLAETLAGGSFTVLAPNNDAFDDVRATLNGLDNDVDALTDVLLYHVIAGAVNSNDLFQGQVIETVQGSTVRVTDLLPRVEFNGDVDVVSADIGCDNGVVHIIDAVLIPPAMPTPPSSGMTGGSGGSSSITCPGSILDGVQDLPQLSILSDLIVDAGLEDTLAGGSFTVLAPNNDAFDDVPMATLDGLTDDVEALRNVLLFHVIDGAVNSGDLLEDQVIETVQGSTITVTDILPRVEFNGDVDVVSADIGCDNGIVHIIDTVLIPPP